MHDEPLTFIGFTHIELTTTQGTNSFTRFTITRSQNAIYPLKSNIATTTTAVESISSRYFLIPFSLGSQGQLAFSSSVLTSLKNPFTRLIIASDAPFASACSPYGEAGAIRYLSRTGQEGLDPPTGGFGDRCSTN